jgi:hypothetical protein
MQNFTQKLNSAHKILSLVPSFRHNQFLSDLVAPQQLAGHKL